MNKLLQVILIGAGLLVIAYGSYQAWVDRGPETMPPTAATEPLQLPEATAPVAQQPIQEPSELGRLVRIQVDARAKRTQIMTQEFEALAAEISRINGFSSLLTTVAGPRTALAQAHVEQELAGLLTLQERLQKELTAAEQPNSGQTAAQVTKLRDELKKGEGQIWADQTALELSKIQDEAAFQIRLKQVKDDMAQYLEKMKPLFAPYQKRVDEVDSSANESLEELSAALRDFLKVPSGWRLERMERKPGLMWYWLTPEGDIKANVRIEVQDADHYGACNPTGGLLDGKYPLLQQTAMQQVNAQVGHFQVGVNSVKWPMPEVKTREELFLMLVDVERLAAVRPE